MKYFVTILSFAVLASALTPTVSMSQTAEDKEGVRAAVEDYVLGFYKGESERIKRSVAENVVKYGYFIPRYQTEYRGSPMSFQQMLDYCNRVKEGGLQTADDAVRDIEILDILDKTAAAKLTATWGIDYMQLAKVDGKWMIKHVMWQSHPRES